MKNILGKIAMTIGILLVIAFVLWRYPLTIEKVGNGEYECHNIFGQYVECD